MSGVRLDAPPGYHLRRTLASWRLGAHDPSMRLADTAAWLARNTPDGPVTVAAEQRGDAVLVECHGPGSTWIEPRLGSLLGFADRPRDFDPAGRAVRDLWRRYGGMHLPRAPRVFERVVQITLQQLVPWEDACGCWGRLVRALGEPAPGPSDELLVPPDATVLSATADYELVALGIRPKQARTLRNLSKHAAKIERAAASGAKALGELLEKIPGVGPWTSAYALGSALAEADAVLLDDYDLPHTVAYVLAGESRADDARMLELLEPYRGHRFRVIRLLWMHGVKAPRRGPRMERYTI